MILPLAAAARLAASAAACGPARGKAARGRGSRTMPPVRAASLRPTGAPAGASQRQARGPLGSSANVQKMHFVQLLRGTQRNKINFLCNCPRRRRLRDVAGGSRAARRNGVASSPATAAACGPARFCRACGAVCGFGAYPPPPSAGYGGRASAAAPRRYRYTKHRFALWNTCDPLTLSHLLAHRTAYPPRRKA